MTEIRIDWNNLNPPKLAHTIICANEKIKIRQYTDKDVQAIRNIRNEDEIVKQLRVRITDDDVWNYFINSTVGIGMRGTRNLGICKKDSNMLIGLISYTYGDPSSIVTCIIDKPYRQRGFGTEAVKEIIRFIFTYTNSRLVIAEHVVGNGPAGKLVRKVGMKYDGLLRGQGLIDGKLIDVKRFSILRDEFDASYRN